MTNRYFEEKNGLDRTFLHCVRLEIDHPDTGARQLVEAPLPGDLRAVLERTSGPGTLRFLDHKNALGASSRHLAPAARGPTRRCTIAAARSTSTRRPACAPGAHRRRRLRPARQRA